MIVKTARLRGRTLNRVELRKLNGVSTAEPPTEEYERPRTRDECRDGPRPCPFVSCRHHLYLEVMTENAHRKFKGAVRLNFADVAPDELERMPETCSLDVADHGTCVDEEIGELMNLSRERVRQIRERAMAKVRRKISM